MARAESIGVRRQLNTCGTYRLTAYVCLCVRAVCRYVGSDELIEVTPAAIRLRKQLLDASQRKLAAKRASQQAAAEVS